MGASANSESETTENAKYKARESEATEMRAQNVKPEE